MRQQSLIILSNFIPNKKKRNKIKGKLKTELSIRYATELLNELKEKKGQKFNPIPNGKKIFWRTSEQNWNDFGCYFKNVERVSNIKKSDIIYRWGLSKMSKIMPYVKKREVRFLEDGFLRSVTTFVDKKARDRERKSVCFVADDLAQHYCADYPSRLELKIKKGDWGEKERQQSGEIIKYIVDNNITKYNHQPIHTPDVLNVKKHKVLIIDQSNGDFSIIFGGNGKQSDFDRMVADAVTENPNSLIFVKVHPDALVHNAPKTGYFSHDNTNYPNVILFAENVNPISVLKAVDKVYVWSSGMGFEALMLKKEVVTYGTPFYAGWGLTTDKHPKFKTPEMKERRGEKRSIEDLFYCSYVWYGRYVNPDTKRPCDITDAIKWLKVNRDFYLKEKYGK